MNMHKDAREHEEIYRIGGLRDQFAIAQLTGLRMHPANESKSNFPHMAEYCYSVADEMLSARKHKDVK